MADEQKIELSVRDKRQQALLARMNKANAVPRVRVVPRDDTIREFIKHQPSQIAFPETGSVEWPDDAFTRRRIADGDVSLEASSESSARGQQGPRGAAAAKSE